MNEVERRQRRLDRARRAIWVELFLGFLLAAITVFVVVAMPGCMCPMFAEPPPLEGRWVAGLGLLGVVVGLASMFRLSRPTVEAREADWRYRDI